MAQMHNWLDANEVQNYDNYVIDQMSNWVVNGEDSDDNFKCVVREGFGGAITKIEIGISSLY